MRYKRIAKVIGLEYLEAINGVGVPIPCKFKLMLKIGEGHLHAIFKLHSYG